MTLALRDTTLDDLGFVLALEADHDVAPFIVRWPAQRHAEAIFAGDEAHLLIVDGAEPVGFVLLGFGSCGLR